jgi:hypothetical protein
MFIVFLNIPVYWSSAGFSGWSRLKCKSRKTFDILVSTKCVFLNSALGGGGLQRGSPFFLGAPVARSTAV